MIVLDRVTVTLKDRTRVTTPLEDVSVRIPSDRRVGILGPPKSGKTTLLRILSGLSRPTSGRIFSDGSLSFPVGMQVGIIARHTVRRNCAVAAKLYRVDPVELIRTVAQAADMRPFLDLPFSYVPPEFQSKLKFAITYALPFDTYLMDGTPLPLAQNMGQLQDLMVSRLSRSGFILCSANENVISKLCDTLFVLRDGKIVPTENMATTLAAFRTERMERSQAGESSQELRTLVREARHLLQLRDYTAAEQKAQECYEKFPEALEPLLLLADIARSTGDIVQANEYLKRACENFPDRNEPWMMVQKLLPAMTSAEMALPWGTMLVAHDNPKFRVAGARILTVHGAPEEALETWRAIVGPNPTTTLGLNDVAQLEFKLGRHEQALATIDTELSMNPSSWRALFLKTRCERALGRFEDMTNTTIILAQVKPELSMPFVGILERSGQREEAKRLSRALRGLVPIAQVAEMPAIEKQDA